MGSSRGDGSPTAGHAHSAGSTPSARHSVVRAGWVLPMTDAGADRPDGHDVIDDGAVCFSEGSIVEVGAASDVLRAWPDAEVTHLAGHALLPGFVNAHTHLAMNMFRGVADDRGLDDFLATVLPLEARSLDERRVGLASRCAMVESHLSGVTTALDMYFFGDAVLDAAEPLEFRVVTGPVFLDGPAPDSGGADLAERLDRGADWMALRGTDPDRPAAFAPHSTYLVSPDALGRIGSLAEASGALLHIHAAETSSEVDDVALRHGRRPVELLEHLGVLGPRSVVAHGVHLSESEVVSLADAGASVVHCPASNLKLGSGVAPVAALLAAGVNVALGTDGAASSNDLDVMGAMRLAALLHKSAGPDGPDPTAVPARAALEMATCNGAEALGLGGRVGLLAPGASADLVAVDLDRPHIQPVHDACSALVYAAGRGDITDVWSRGARVVRAGRHTRVDSGEVGEALRGLAAEIAGA